MATDFVDTTITPIVVTNATPIVLQLDPSRGEDGSPGAAGQGLNWRDAWQTGIAYNAYDLVSRNGGSYIAEVNNTSVDPATDNGSVWGVISSPGTPGPPGPAGMKWRGAWNASTSYAINDGVSQLGQSYIAVSASTGINPSGDGGTHWQLMAASGSGGDMYKSTYDTNGDGIVDSAAVAAAVPYAGVTGKPATFPSDWTTTANKPASFPSDWNTTVNKPPSFPAAAHGATHTSTGGDAIPAASTTAGGLLKALSGLVTDYVGGDNACHPIPTIPPVADATQNGLLRKVSGLTTDFVDGTNNCQPIAPVIWAARLRSFNAVGNPNCECTQRNCASVLTNPASGMFIEDRWQANKTGTWTANFQSALGGPALVVPGTSFRISARYLSVTLTGQQASLAASDSMQITQVVEGPQLRELIGDVHSISILVNSSVAGLKFCVYLRDVPATQSLVKLCTIPAANTWTLIQLPNIPVWPSGNFSILPGVVGYQLGICLAAGATLTAPANDVWQNGNFIGAPGMSNFASNVVGSTFGIAFVQHEPGPLCTTLIDKPWFQNYEECLRYFCKSYDYNTALGTNTSAGQCTGWIPSGGSADLNAGIRFPKPMAIGAGTAPVLNGLGLYSWTPAGTPNAVRDVGGALDRGVNTFSQPGMNGFKGMILGTGIVASSYGIFQYKADTGW